MPNRREWAYRIAGLVVSSTLPLEPLLEAHPGQAHDWRLTRAPAARSRERADWFRRWYDPDGRLWLTFGRVPGGFRLRFAHSATFDVLPASREIRCRPAPGAPARTLRHLFLNQVFPLVAASSARLVLHASAVVGPVGAMAFVGAGGSGKSTLAAALTKRGFRLVTDDALVLQRADASFVVRPTFPEVRLWPDTVRAIAPGGGRGRPTAHYTSKRRLDAVMAAGFDEAPEALARVYLLDHDPAGRDDVAVSLLSSREAIVALVRCAFILDTGDRSLLRSTLELLAGLVERVEVCRLRYPWALTRLDEVVSALVDPPLIRVAS